MAYPNDAGSKAYLVPELTGIVEFYCGNKADLQGSYWHICDGRSYSLPAGGTFTTPNIDGRYIEMMNGAGGITGESGYSVGWPSTATANSKPRLIEGAHNHNNTTGANNTANWPLEVSRHWYGITGSSGTHSHKHTSVTTPLYQTATGVADMDSSNNNNTTRYAQESGNANKYTETDATISISNHNHSHSVELTPIAMTTSDMDGNHRHVIESNHTDMQLISVQTYAIVYIAGVKNTG